MARLFGLHILHFSLQRDHLHLFVEAKDNSNLAAGMRSFGSSLGKALRKVLGGRGPVFLGRYHLHVLSNPTETKRALQYVIQNRAKHSRVLPHVDPYSSARYFSRWQELNGQNLSPLLADHPASDRPSYLSPPRSWLAREGWTRGRTTG